jgi:hypothetical protein
VYQLTLDYASDLTYMANHLSGEYKAIPPDDAGLRFYWTLILIEAILALIGATGGGAGIALLGIMIGPGGTCGNVATHWFGRLKCKKEQTTPPELFWTWSTLMISWYSLP